MILKEASEFKLYVTLYRMFKIKWIRLCVNIPILDQPKRVIKNNNNNQFWKHIITYQIKYLEYIEYRLFTQSPNLSHSTPKKKSFLEIKYYI